MNTAQITVNGYQAELLQDLLDRLLYAIRYDTYIQSPVVPEIGIKWIEDLKQKSEDALSELYPPTEYPNDDDRLMMPDCMP